MTATIRAWGNSQGLYLSKKLLEEAGLQVNDSVELRVESGAITIRKDDSDDIRRKAWESLKAIKASRKVDSAIPEDYRTGRDEYLDERYGR